MLDVDNKNADVIDHQYQFLDNFLFGAATAGHQVEGNNINSDIWFLEHVKPTVFCEPSGDACNSFDLWESDLDLIAELGLTAYRFSIEWSRIEPEYGQFSMAMVQHYAAIIDGCLHRGITPIITLNHFANPLWFAKRGGWTNQDAPKLFETYCSFIGKHLGDKIQYALTFNEPNILRTLNVIGMPDSVWALQNEMLQAAADKLKCRSFSGVNAANRQDFEQMMQLLIEGHKLGRNALKQHNANMQVGFSLAMLDDQACGDNSVIEQKRQENYGQWFEAAEFADFVGVQNYERVVWDDKGMIPVPTSAMTNDTGSWVDPSSLANAVAYVHQVTQKPIMVTEHGLATNDDAARSRFLQESLARLSELSATGVPVLGYIHWTLLDNFEWTQGYQLHFGLYSVDLKTFKRTAKPSAYKFRDLVARSTQRNAAVTK